MVSEPVSEKIDTGKSLGTGIGKIWYRKKVSEPVSEKFGTEKSTGIGIENIWYRIKVSVSVSFNILGTVTHCQTPKRQRFCVAHVAERAPGGLQEPIFGTKIARKSDFFTLHP